MILRRSSSKFVHIKLISYQTWLPGVWPVLCNSNFKNLLLWNHWSEFNNISREWSLGGPLLSLFKSNWYLIKHSCQLVWPVLCNSNFKNLLGNHWLEFNNISQEWSLGGPLLSLFKSNWYLIKHSCQWVWPVLCNSNFKIFYSETTGQIYHYLTEMILRWHSLRFVKIVMLPWKTWPPVGVACFIQWIFWKFSYWKHVRIHVSEFNNIFQKRSLGGPLSSLFKWNWYLIKHGHQGCGPFYVTIISKSFFSETTG